MSMQISGGVDQGEGIMLNVRSTVMYEYKDANEVPGSTSQQDALLRDTCCLNKEGARLCQKRKSQDAKRHGPNCSLVRSGSGHFYY
jgi:hypothetical protein